jgi:hypothetical protein
LNGTSHSLPQSEQVTFVISLGPESLGPPKFLEPPKLFDPNIVLLIQYKTVQSYTPLEHKNFSIGAEIGAVRIENLSQGRIACIVSDSFHPLTVVRISWIFNYRSYGVSDIVWDFLRLALPQDE